MSTPPLIRSPDDPALSELCFQLAASAELVDQTGAWPAEPLRMCAEYGVFRWFQPETWGGLEWDSVSLLRGYLRLSAACLTTTFILTQRSGACQRIAGSENQAAKERWLLDLAEGRQFATVAISHLTTSRRHLVKPAWKPSKPIEAFGSMASAPGSLVASTPMWL